MELLTKENFKDKTSKGKVIVQFSADWCGPCKMATPIIEELSKDCGIPAYKIDTDSQPDLTAEHHVMTLPSIIFFNNGSPEAVQVGLANKQVLKEKFGL